MDAHDQPDWDLLPQNPLGFFQLRVPFDRRDLKRAYGKLIRHFKPETYPEEFQRIRAAYEELESHLRYGQSQQDATDQNQAWNLATPAPQTDGAKECSESLHSKDDHSLEIESNAPSPSIDPPTVVEQAMENPHWTYQTLLGKVERTPQEYYVLAVLSDLVKPDDPQQSFFHWILSGLESHPGDHGLQCLIQQYVRTSVALDDAAVILRGVAATVRSPAFYWITESLWEKWLRERDFTSFATLLTECESNIQSVDDAARHAFYLRILRTAIWKAPADWTSAIIDQLESQAITLQPYLLQELEFVTMIRDHLVTTSESLRRYEARSRLEQFLYHFCTSDGPSATVAMTAELSQVAREANSVRAAFPSLCERDETPLYMLIYLATDELQQSSGLGFERVDDDQNNLLARALLNDLKPSHQTIIHSLNAISFQYRWLTFMAGLAIAMVFAILCFLVTVTIFIKEAFPLMVMFGVPILYMVAFFFWIFPKHLEPRLDLAQGKQWWRLYEEHWRERIFRYIQSCSEPPMDALERVVVMGKIQRQEDWAELVKRFASNDIGLLIFGQTQAFVV